jgi:hypothetical protein
MRRGTFTDSKKALDWMKEELKATPPMPSDLPVEAQVRYAWDCLDRSTDAYVGYYTASGFMVRALLTCPRDGEQCPEPPA